MKDQKLPHVCCLFWYQCLQGCALRLMKKSEILFESALRVYFHCHELRNVCFIALTPLEKQEGKPILRVRKIKASMPGWQQWQQRQRMENIHKQTRNEYRQADV